MKNSKNILLIFLLIILLLLSVIAASSVGSADLSILDSLKIFFSKFPLINKLIDTSDIRNVYFTIIWRVRMPRIILSALTGASLAVVGSVFQGLLRNPLADPHILGISSGAAIGATIAMLTGLTITFFGLGIISIFAFIGALLTVFLVYRISVVGNKIPVVNVVLTGTAISSMLSALISLIMVLHKDTIEKVYLWTLGSFSSATWSKVMFLLVFAIICIPILTMFARELNLIATGEDTAESLGVDTALTKKILIIISSFLVAACVCVSGIIGFVGLIIPHCIRILAGPKHEKLLPLSCLGGAIFMIVCDTVSRTIIEPSEIPVGIITSFIGAPYFIFLLYCNRNKSL